MSLVSMTMPAPTPDYRLAQPELLQPHSEQETSFCTLTQDTDLELNAWQNAVKALTGKNNALTEQSKLL